MGLLFTDLQWSNYEQKQKKKLLAYKYMNTHTHSWNTNKMIWKQISAIQQF